MDILFSLFRVLVELFFTKTGALVLRALSFGRIVVTDDFSFLPFSMARGTIAVQEWAALIFGMMFWAVVVTVIIGLSR